MFWGTEECEAPDSVLLHTLYSLWLLSFVFLKGRRNKIVWKLWKYVDVKYFRATVECNVDPTVDFQKLVQVL